MNSLLITWCGPETENPLERFVCWIRMLHPLSRERVSIPQQSTCLGKRCHENACSPSCCLVTDYSGFHTFWHTRCHKNIRQLRSNRALASCCPAMDVHSHFTVPAFSRHVTVSIDIVLYSSHICSAFSNIFVMYSLGKICAWIGRRLYTVS
jgi:hypothetical protein